MNKAMKKAIAIGCLAVFLTACGAAKSEKPAGDTTAAKTEPTSTIKTETTSTTKTETTSTTAVTGVPACDEYLAKVEKFMNNPQVPQASRDAYRQTLEQNRTAWKQAASTPQGRAQLETRCKSALESIKPALEQYDK